MENIPFFVVPYHLSQNPIQSSVGNCNAVIAENFNDIIQKFW